MDYQHQQMFVVAQLDQLTAKDWPIREIERLLSFRFDNGVYVLLARLLGVRRPGAALVTRGACYARVKTAALRAGVKRRQAAALQGGALVFDDLYRFSLFRRKAGAQTFMPRDDRVQ